MPIAPSGQAKLIVSLTVLVGLLALLSLAVGPAGAAVLAGAGDVLAGRPTAMAAILLELRLPRCLLAILVGLTLGMSGAVMQAFLRNPLAEPGVLGVSSCAAFGATVVFYGGLAAISPLILPAGGIVGAFTGSLLVGLLARRGLGVATLVLVGVAINALSAAATAMVLSLSPNPFAFYEISLWLMGSIADRTLTQVLLALPFVIVGGALLWRTRAALDALTLGEEAAQGLGFDLARTGQLILAGAAMAVGASVAVSGVVGFVGLMAPHGVRAAVGHRPSASLVPAALVGAALVLAADLAIRLLATEHEIQLGVLTALLGAPFLLWLAIRRGPLGDSWK